MGFLTEHKHTEITDHLDKILSSRSYDLEAEIPELIELIRTKNEPVYTDNQEEAARNLRKKLKYGKTLQQSRALDTLHILITKSVKFTVLYNDEKLLDRLRVIGLGTARLQDGNGKTYSPKVIQKCSKYMILWYKYILEMGLTKDRCYSKLFSSCARVKQFRQGGHGQRSVYLTDDGDNGETTQMDPDRKYKIPKINLNKAAPKIKSTISDSLAAAVSLQNALVTMPPGTDAMDDKRATECFVQARTIRRKVLRYLQLVTEGEFLGALIHANEELVSALTKYDEMCKNEEVRDMDLTTSSSVSSLDSAGSEGDNGLSLSGNDTSSSNDNDSDSYCAGRQHTVTVTQDRHSIVSYPSSTTSNPFGDQNEI